MKLQAITICINYADYLECIVVNKKHFDRWVIVTVPSDDATHAVCEASGIECYDSRVLKPDGSNFNAAFHKYSVINEGLDLLDPESWAVILDGDILLPMHFRERLEALPLQSGSLYGMAGRKIITDRRQFEMAKDCEPWDRLVGRNAQPIGYFNLFDLKHSRNRYPKSTPRVKGDHDDYLFTNGFPREHRRSLPMTVIHTGPISKNWFGRADEHYKATKKPIDQFKLPGEIIAHLNGPKMGVSIGYFPGGRWRKVLQSCDRKFLIDQFLVHAPSQSPMLEADRKVLRRLWRREASGIVNLELIGSHSLSNLSKIPDASVDLLYLSGEVLFDWLMPAMPHWEEKLNDGAIICGDFFGLPEWPEATHTISLIIGRPDGVEANGFWWKKHRKPHRKRNQIHCAQQNDCGVVLVSDGNKDLEPLFLSLFSVRKHWSGPVQVFHWREEDASLFILCGFLDIKLNYIRPELIKPQEDAEEKEEVDIATLLNETKAMVSFQKALILVPGMLATGPLSAIFAGRKSSSRCEGIQPWYVETSRFGTEIRRLTSYRSGNYKGQKGSILICQGDPETWTAHAWKQWSNCLQKLASKMTTEIRSPKDAALVAIVSPETIAEFQYNWLTWNFSKETPLIVFLVGINTEKLWLPGKRSPTSIVEVLPECSADLQWFTDTIENICNSKRVIFLPPMASALPGAELWMAEYWNQRDIVAHHPRATSKKQIPTVQFDSFFGIVKLEYLRTLLKRSPFTSSIGPHPPAPFRFRDYIANQPRAKVDATEWGWKTSNVLQSPHEVKNS